jgi:hypothetical protein
VGDYPSGQFVIKPQTSRYDPEDDRWLAQVNELRAALDADLGLVIDEVVRFPPGLKGAAEFGHALVIQLPASPSVLRAVLGAMQTWLDKDRTRSIMVSWSSPDGQVTLELTGTDMRSADIDQALTSALGPRAPGVPKPKPRPPKPKQAQ